MTSSAANSSSSGMASQQGPAQLPVTKNDIPFGPRDAARPGMWPMAFMTTGAARASLASSPVGDAGLASQGSVSPASRAEPARRPANGHAASTSPAPDVTVGASNGAVAQPSEVQDVQQIGAASAAKAEPSAAAEDQQRVEPSELGLGSTEENEDHSWQALLARPAHTRLPNHAPDLKPAQQRSLQPQDLSSPAAYGSIDLPGSAAVNTQRQPQDAETREDPLQSYLHLSDEYLGLSDGAAVEKTATATSGGEHPADIQDSGPRVAKGYAALSDSYLSPAKPGHGASGTAASVAGSVEHRSGALDGDAADGALLSDSYLSLPELSQRASGALPVSRSAASGPPSQSTLNPIEQRQLGMLPVSDNSASQPPFWPALGPVKQPQQGRPPQRPSSPMSRQSGQHSQYSRRRQGPDAGSSASSRLHDVQHDSAVPTDAAGDEGARRASPSSVGGNSGASTKQDSPSRPWLGADGPPPSRIQRPIWMADDSKQDVWDRSWVTGQHSSNPGPSVLSDSNGAAPEQSHEELSGEQ